MATLVLEEPAASPRAFRPWVVDPIKKKDIFWISV